jgi:hypothetical protein
LAGVGARGGIPFDGESERFRESQSVFGALPRADGSKAAKKARIFAW